MKGTISDPAKIATACMLAVLIITFVGCDPEEIADPALVSISVRPANSYTNPELTVQFTVNATYSDGAIIDDWSPDAGFTWASSDTAVAAIDEDGLATADDPGETTIAAVYSSGDDGDVTGSTTLTVLLDPVSIAISPTSVTVDAGSSTQLTATATFDDASQTDVSQWAEWSSDNQAIARVSSRGRVTGTSVGSTTINVTFGLVTDSIPVTVNAPPEDPDVVTAVAVAQISYAIGVLAAFFEGDVEGLDVDLETGEAIFTNFDISELEMGYSAVSGTVSPNLDESIDFELTFTGGPISSLQFTLTSEQLEALDMEESVSVDVIADGEEHTVTLVPATVE